MVLPLNQVRRLAEENGYKESKLNTESRVIVFQKGSTKINVYYTTGTVATCLNHPRQGKTQMFRRNISLNDLENIFHYPRVHTGVGYQLKKNMSWMPIDISNIEQEEECDLARRWRYVCYATNLCNDEEIEQVVSFCRLYRFLEYSKNADVTSRGYECRRAGAGCSLGDLLQEVARDYYDAKKYSFTDVDGNDHYFEIGAQCHCDDGVRYCKNFRGKLNQLRRLLVSLSDPVRREVLFWFIGRWNFSIIDENDEECWTREDTTTAHRDYSAQYYPKRLEVCSCHGL
jgi:hypothetical protein